jgi:Beta-galactosidase
MRRRSLLAAGLTPMLHGTTGAATPLTLLPPGGDARFERAYFGLHVHHAGRERHWPQIGIGSLRLWDADVSWAYLERVEGRYDFKRLDEYLDWAAGRGVEVLLPLGVTPPWASARPEEAGAYGKGTAAEPARIDSWRRYVRAVATHARGRVAAYQVWNEANERIFFSGTPAALAQLMVAAAEEVRRIDPTARLVAPSAVGLDDRVLWPSRLLRQGAAASVDAVAFHLYHSGHPPESMIAPVQKLHAAQAAAGLGELPLWNTESGYWMPNVMVDWSPDEQRNMISEELAAAYLPRDLILARALGVQRFFWYAWDGSKMGLISPLTQRLRAPALAYGQVIRELTGATLQRCARAASGVWTAQLRRPDGSAMQALWLDATADSASLRLPTPLAGARRTLRLDGASDWRAADARTEVGAAVTLVVEGA